MSVAPMDDSRTTLKNVNKMIHPHTYIHPNAKLATNVKIDPFTVIHQNVEIGEGTWIGSNVTIMEGARIGKNCRIRYQLCLLSFRHDGFCRWSAGPYLKNDKRG